VQAETVSGGEAKPGRARWRRVLVVVLGLAAAGLAAVVLDNSSDELLTAADTLTGVSWGWVMVALVAEVASYAVRGAAQAVVLRGGTASAAAGAATDPCTGLGAAVPGTAVPGTVVLGAATWAGDAAAYCLPFGFAASGVVMFRALRRRGVEAALAGWMFAVASLMYIGAVAVLTIVAVQVAGDADPIPGLQTVSAALLGVLVLVAVGYTLARRGPLARAWTRWRTTRRALRAQPDHGGHGGAPGRLVAAGTLVAGWVRARSAELAAVRLSPTRTVAALTLMMISWLADIAVLGIAFAALDATPPWAGLLLAYCAGQIAAAVPITPGGIGVVEGSLTLALVAFGGAATVTLAAVLLYRLIAYWGCIPLGGLLWLGLRATAPARPEVGSSVAQRALEGDLA